MKHKHPEAISEITMKFGLPTISDYVDDIVMDVNTLNAKKWYQKKKYLRKSIINNAKSMTKLDNQCRKANPK